MFVSSLQAVTRPPHTYIYPCHIFHVPDNVYTVFFSLHMYISLAALQKDWKGFGVSRVYAYNHF